MNHQIYANPATDIWIAAATRIFWVATNTRVTCRSITTVWVIKGEAGTVVVDTGFDEGAAAARGRTLIRPVAEGLAAIGVDAEHVRDVVITHLHYDHAGNVALFPRARFHVQDAEMAYCTGRAMTHPQLSAPFDAENVVEHGATRLRPACGLSRRRCRAVSGCEPAPSARTHVGTAGGARGYRPRPGRAGLGRHTLLGKSGARDSVPDRRRRCRVPRITAYAARHRSPHLSITLIPGHDPEVLARFPAEPGVTDVVRLDLPPRARSRT